MITHAAVCTVDEFRERLADVHARIVTACTKAGRESTSVRLLPVSKTVSEERLRVAYAAGCRVFGENKAQEAQRNDIEHLNGNLQMVATATHEIEARDRKSVV